MKSRTARPHLWAAALLIGAAGAAYAHGDVTPQAVDTKGLPELGETWRAENPCAPQLSRAVPTTSSPSRA